MKLKTETNTPEMEKRILAAFAVSGKPQADEATADFEHGQWWITTPDGAQYSVVDAEGGQAIDGFDFELVTEEGEE
ncbi:MAG TPA: hypothetical protein VE687_11715 [Stellaceae bacterium]|jgi:hypothetical protein|nr:hypothetical protein [Stellaceae bacterium]